MLEHQPHREAGILTPCLRQAIRFNRSNSNAVRKEGPAGTRNDSAVRAIRVRSAMEDRPMKANAPSRCPTASRTAVRPERTAPAPTSTSASCATTSSSCAASRATRPRSARWCRVRAISSSGSCARPGSPRREPWSSSARAPAAPPPRSCRRCRLAPACWRSSSTPSSTGICVRSLADPRLHPRTGQCRAAGGFPGRAPPAGARRDRLRHSVFDDAAAKSRDRIAAAIAQVLRPGGRFVAYQVRAHVADFVSPYLGEPDKQWEVVNVPPVRVFTWVKAGG